MFETADFFRDFSIAVAISKIPISVYVSLGWLHSASSITTVLLTVPNLIVGIFLPSLTKLLLYTGNKKIRRLCRCSQDDLLQHLGNNPRARNENLPIKPTALHKYKGHANIKQY